jgi:hypothetical protein
MTSLMGDELPPPDLTCRLLISVLLLTALCDVVIYRGQGFAGIAALLVGAPLLMCLARFRPRRKVDLAIVSGLLIGLAARLLWSGSAPAVVMGFALLAAFAMTLSGLRPYVIETIVFGSQTVAAGVVSGVAVARTMRGSRIAPSRLGWLSVAFPLGAAVSFGLLFLLANPDLLSSLGNQLEYFFTNFRRLILEFAPGPTEIVFWGAVIWIATGMLRPIMQGTLFEEKASANASEAGTTHEATRPAPLYAAFRNTLITVIVLFAVYLAYEFMAMRRGTVPEGLNYSQYAHEGAFWLTVALALATAMLSLVFRGAMLADARMPRLRRLAWIWSLENFLLAVAVYHRLMIYIGFNGMTRLRVVALLGISCVVVGFLMVLRKIAAGHGFVWLVRRQLWTLVAFVYLYMVTPVDALVMRYNVQRILAGDMAPCVQISVHTIDAEGILQLPLLLDCDNETIREGVRALLSTRFDRAKADAAKPGSDHWTAFQWSKRDMLRRLDALGPELHSFESPRQRTQVFRDFRDYAYQWY